VIRLRQGRPAEAVAGLEAGLRLEEQVSARRGPAPATSIRPTPTSAPVILPPRDATRSRPSRSGRRCGAPAATPPRPCGAQPSRPAGTGKPPDTGGVHPCRLPGSGPPGSLTGRRTPCARSCRRPEDVKRSRAENSPCPAPPGRSPARSEPVPLAQTPPSRSPPLSPPRRNQFRTRNPTGVPGRPQALPVARGAAPNLHAHARYRVSVPVPECVPRLYTSAGPADGRRVRHDTAGGGRCPGRGGHGRTATCSMQPGPPLDQRIRGTVRCRGRAKRSPQGGKRRAVPGAVFPGCAQPVGTVSSKVVPAAR
jgi:hypothetical protein